jgi:hypothetical protein
LVAYLVVKETAFCSGFHWDKGLLFSVEPLAFVERCLATESHRNAEKAEKKSTRSRTREGMSVFDLCSDYAVVEILSWLFAKSARGAVVSTTRSTVLQLRDIAAFGATCKRMRSVVQSPILWRSIDIGMIVNEARTADRKREAIVRILRGIRPHIAACSKMSNITGVRSAHTLALVLA